MGALGVMMAAAAAHGGGGETARIGADFLLIHAAAIFGLCGVTARTPAPDRGLLTASTILAAGAILFSGDLALAALADLRPFPLAAPLGGFILIAGWLAVAAAVLRSMVRPG